MLLDTRRWRGRRATSRRTAGALAAEAKLAEREIRGYEAEHVGSLVHWDCHVGSRKVLTPGGEWRTPVLFGVLDDRSRVACHLWGVMLVQDSAVRAMYSFLMRM